MGDCRDLTVATYLGVVIASVPLVYTCCTTASSTPPVAGGCGGAYFQRRQFRSILAAGAAGARRPVFSDNQDENAATIKVRMRE